MLNVNISKEIIKTTVTLTQQLSKLFLSYISFQLYDLLYVPFILRNFHMLIYKSLHSIYII